MVELTSFCCILVLVNLITTGSSRLSRSCPSPTATVAPMTAESTTSDVFESLATASGNRMGVV